MPDNMQTAPAQLWLPQDYSQMQQDKTVETVRCLAAAAAASVLIHASSKRKKEDHAQTTRHGPEMISAHHQRKIQTVIDKRMHSFSYLSEQTSPAAPCL
jgi:hypothetical protein